MKEKLGTKPLFKEKCLDRERSCVLEGSSRSSSSNFGERTEC